MSAERDAEVADLRRRLWYLSTVAVVAWMGATDDPPTFTPEFLAAFAEDIEDAQRYIRETGGPPDDGASMPIADGTVAARLDRVQRQREDEDGGCPHCGEPTDECWCGA